MKTGLRLRLALLLACIVISFQSYAQSDEMISRRYLMKDGLSHNFTSCILQDSNGFLWVGTESGLNRFDGIHFKNYLENPSDSNSLKNNNILCLWEDDQKHLWVGTSSGVQLLDLETGQFLNDDIFSDSTLHITKRNLIVNKIRGGKQGTAWICTNQGIFSVNTQTLTVNRSIVTNTNGDSTSNHDENNYWDIAEQTDGTLWAASKSGLLCIKAGRDTIRYHYDPDEPNSLADDQVRSLHIDNKGRLWIGTVYGLNLYNPDNETYLHFLPEALQTYSSPNPRLYVNAIIERPDGKLWVGFGDGLYGFDPHSKRFFPLVEWHVWSLHQDQQEIVWLGSVDGLSQIAVESDKFNAYERFGKARISGVASVAEDIHGQVWLTGYDIDQGDFLVFLYSPSENHFSQYQHDSNLHFTGIEYVEADSSKLWMTTAGKLIKLDISQHHYTVDTIPMHPTCIHPDSQGNIWLGGWSGLGKYDPINKKYERFVSFPDDRVYCIVEDQDQNLWIGTYTEGLLRYNLETCQLDSFTHDPNDPFSISNNKVTCLTLDTNGTLWIGTGGGLNKLVWNTKKGNPEFIHWRSSNSALPYDEIDSIIEGEDGLLWISSGNTISQFSTNTSGFRTYDYHDGLPSQRFWTGMKASNGEIFFGSNALISFHPDSLQDNPYIPPVQLTDFTIHNQPVPVRGSYEDTLDWESPLAQSITHTKSLELSHWQNDFSLEFAALNFINPENNQYQYRLEPYEEEWIGTTADNRIARYTNLSPGEYTFRVKASNNDGLWNEAGTSLQLTILPPWWQTGWAYGLYVILGFSLLFSLRQYTVKRERLKHELNLQRLEAEKMHTVDQMKSRFFANISHEFRTPLTLILGPLEKYVQQSETDSNEQQTFRMMRRNARQLLHLINQLLDLSKLEAGKMELKATPQMIQSFLQPIGLSFSVLAERKQIRYHFRYPKENPVLYFDTDKLEKIITNLLSNAFKFTPAGEEIIFSARLKPATGKTKSNGSTATQILELEVKDRGEGMEEEQLQHIFQRFYQAHTTQDSDSEGSGIGLSLVKELVELHGGEISVSSEKDQGSSFLVHLPLEEADFEAFISEPARQKDSFISEEPEQKEDTEDKQTDAPIQEDESIPLLLVVEDNADVRVFIRETLKSDYRLLEADNGREGYKKAVEAIPDLILSDVMMPGMDGVELCGKLKADEKTSHVPIILLTAKASGGDKIEGLQTGADDYIVKPFEAMELAARIENLIESRRKLREQFSREITLQPSAIQITSADEQFLQEVMEIVEANMANFNFSEAVLHQQMSLSKTQLYRKLKALTDHAPNELIQMMRLKRAAELLAAKAGNVGEISFVVGFRDHSYFSRRFHKQYGMTPSEYAASVAK